MSNHSLVSFLVSKDPIPFYLVQLTIDPGKAEKPKPKNIDHVLLVDVSGSMAGELGNMADQIANKLPTMIQPGHTLTLIRYSGRGQCETVFKARPITGEIGSFASVAAAIRRALRPVGMTAFVDPFVECKRVIEDLKRTNPGHEIHVYQQTDGCETEGYTTAEILKAAGEIAPLISTFTVFEYGSYCDRRLLAAIAAKVGGEHVPCRSFLDYDPALTQRVRREGTGGGKIRVVLDGVPLGSEPFAFSCTADAITIYSVEQDEDRRWRVSLPEATREIGYFSAMPVGRLASGGLAQVAEEAARADGRPRDKGAASALTLAYAGLGVLVQRQDIDEAFGVLGALGDVQIASLIENAFTKPEFDLVVDAARAAAFGAGRFAAGWDAHRVPKFDAWTVLQTLHVIADDPETRIVFDDPAHPFEYAAIGRARDESPLLREEDIERIKALFAEMPSVRTFREAVAQPIIATALAAAVKQGKDSSAVISAEAVRGEQLADLLDDFTATMPTVNTARRLTQELALLDVDASPDAAVAAQVCAAVTVAIANAKPKLVLDEDKPVGGYRLDGLMFTSDRANVSIRVKKRGIVDATPALPQGEEWVTRLSPGERSSLSRIETSTMRSYAIIRDGMLNVKRLPVRLGARAWEKLAEHGVVSGPHTKDVISLDLSKLPVMNRAMAGRVRADEIIRTEYEIMQLSGAIKVLDHYRDLWPRAARLSAKFGPTIAEWLVSVGVRDSGFNPPAPKVKAKDIAYRARIMKIGIAGLSDLPSVAETRTRMEAIASGTPVGKSKKAPTLTTGMEMLAPTIREVDNFLTKAKVSLEPFDPIQLAGFKRWLDDKVQALESKKATLEREQQGRVFVMVAGGVRPVDLKPGEVDVSMTTAEGVVIKGKVAPVLKDIAL